MIVCYCFQVTREDIESRLAQGESLAGIRATTGLGYGSGGCASLAERTWGVESAVGIEVDSSPEDASVKIFPSCSTPVFRGIGHGEDEN
ncbi:MAG: (2Fe-2S)-binding protein [Pseudomonadales bacterium]|nr:(2Fe-2S)-binding protein [Pseudomonadales bacterium]